MTSLFLRRGGFGIALGAAMALQIAGARCEEVMVTIDNFTFSSTGDYKYFCSLHPHMTGMIKVE